MMRAGKAKVIQFGKEESHFNSALDEKSFIGGSSQKFWIPRKFDNTEWKLHRGGRKQNNHKVTWLLEKFVMEFGDVWAITRKDKKCI